MIEGYVRVAITSYYTHMKSIKPKLEKTELSRKYKSVGNKSCLDCLDELYTMNILTFTMPGLTIRTEEDAVKAFEEGWVDFVKCWNEYTNSSATAMELNELKVVFTNSLGKFINDLLKSVSGYMTIYQRKSEKTKDEKKGSEVIVKMAKKSSK